MPYRHPSWSRILRAFCLIIICWTVIEVAYVQRALRRHDGTGRVGQETVYIASIHWNNEAVLRSHWTNAVLDLVKELGPENVFVSIQESGSWDDSKGALRILDAHLEDLGVRKQVVLEPTTHLDEINKPPTETGWIRTPRDKVELRRIPYLARLRNEVMEPMYEMHASGTTFDKILFLNDVVFTPEDVRNLLSTRNGEYAAACSLDFSKPPRFYDTFALRDSEGHEALTQTWPFFRSHQSRQAMKSNSPVPVKSCWNGMVVMDALPFYGGQLSFRGIPDSLALKHVEGSECCLIHADNPLSKSKGVWLNPQVRVGYNGGAYDAVNSDTVWLSTWPTVRGLWGNRFLRWFSTTWFKIQIVRWRLSGWTKESEENREPGDFCLINEMQVLVYNGWAHV